MSVVYEGTVEESFGGAFLLTITALRDGERQWASDPVPLPAMNRKAAGILAMKALRDLATTLHPGQEVTDG